MTGTLKKRNNFRWFVYAPIAFLSFFPSVSKAQDNNGINAVYYQVTDIPPSKSDYVYDQCNSEIENNINRSFDGEAINGCPQDMFMAHYTGFITLPQHQTIRFWIAADDGGTIKIGTTEWGDWNDKGCSAEETDALTLDAGVPLVLDAWYYENGGNTCFMLAWNINEEGWEMVPDSAFTTFIVPETTTSTSTTTTSTSTTTTSTTSTSTTSTTTIVPIVTTTEVARTTTTSQQPTTSSSSTTLTIPETTTTVYQPTSTSTSSTTTTTLPIEVTPAKAATIASDTAALAQLDTAEAERVFKALSLEDLPPDEVAQIIAAVQDAPVAIRKAFEAKVNVFSGAADTYVPIGSKVDIKTRRVIVVSTAFMIAMPPPPPVRRKQ